MVTIIDTQDTVSKEVSLSIIFSGMSNKNIVLNFKLCLFYINLQNLTFDLEIFFTKQMRQNFKPPILKVIDVIPIWMIHKNDPEVDGLKFFKWSSYINAQIWLLSIINP